MSTLVIAAAQSASVRGDVDENVAAHVRFARAAASFGVKLLVFPELSLTGYELDLARVLQLEVDDPRLAPLRGAAKEHDMHLLAGGPLVSVPGKPYLGALLISPGRSICYAKIHVHESEEKYFVPGNDGCVVSVGGARTGIAICADTSHPTHAADAAERGAELYVASVMKTEAEYPRHAGRLRQYAEHHGMAVLTANHAGSTGGADSAGKSAVWDERGRLVARAGSNEEALVVARRDDGPWCGEVVTVP